MAEKTAEMKTKRILHLTLHRKWFDLIASGAKVLEFRQDNEYWHKRIFNNDGWDKKFDEIHFRNGYGDHRPLMVTEFLFALVSHSNLCSCDNGEELNGRVIVIAIGNRLRFENYSCPGKRLCGGCGILIPEENCLCDACVKRIDASVVPWSKETMA